MLRCQDVMKLFKSSRPFLYEMMADGTMVRSIKLGPKFAAWPEYECNAILAARIQGCEDWQIRALVVELIEARKTLIVKKV